MDFGKPCVAGTRLIVQNVLELVREGNPFDAIIGDYYPDLRQALVILLEQLHSRLWPDKKTRPGCGSRLAMRAIADRTHSTVVPNVRAISGMSRLPSDSMHSATMRYSIVFCLPSRSNCSS